MAARTLTGLVAGLPPGVLAVWDRLCLRADGYLVGGAVRDLLLDRTPRDYDLATALGPEAVAEALSLRPGRGGRFGSLRVPGLALEVVCMREESAYADRRRPQRVRFGAPLLADLRRRDFTVNAMALGRDGALIDPHGGLRDLRHGTLRCVGAARARLAEDLLRVLRAYRLAAELDLRIAPSVRAAARELAEELPQLAPERVGQELLRLMEAPGALRGVRQMAHDGVLERVAPFLRPAGRDFPGRLLRLVGWSLGGASRDLDAGLRRLAWPGLEREEAVSAARLAEAVLGTGERPAWREALARHGPQAAGLLVQVGGRQLAAFARLFGDEGVLDRSRLRLRGEELAAAEGLRPEEIGRRELQLLREMWRSGLSGVERA